MRFHAIISAILIARITDTFAGGDGYGGISAGITGGVIPAAVYTKHSVTYRDVPSTKKSEETPLVEIPAKDVPLFVEFKTQSSPVYVKQTHIKGVPQYQHSRSQDEPNFVQHVVYKPVIHEIREIIKPFRKVVQQVQPVNEQVNTLVAAGSPRVAPPGAPNAFALNSISPASYGGFGGYNSGYKIAAPLSNLITGGYNYGAPVAVGKAFIGYQPILNGIPKGYPLIANAYQKGYASPAIVQSGYPVIAKAVPVGYAVADKVVTGYPITQNDIPNGYETFGLKLGASVGHSYAPAYQIKSKEDYGLSGYGLTPSYSTPVQLQYIDNSYAANALQTEPEFGYRLSSDNKIAHRSGYSGDSNDHNDIVNNGILRFYKDK